MKPGIVLQPIDPYDVYLVHSYSHTGLVDHPDCPWCQPFVPADGEQPWLTLGSIKIYAPR